MAKRILVIDDELECRLIIKAGLEGRGYVVETADDGLEGLNKARSWRPDVVLLDLMTPKMHGYEVIQHLRADPATSRTPIVVLSAKQFASDQRKALELGANAFVGKPFDPEEIQRQVRNFTTGTKVTFWGVRGSIASPGPETVRYGGNTPCVTVEHDGHMLVLDAGTGIRRLGLMLMKQAAGQPVEVDLLITHTHWDHIQGFPFFVPAFVPGNRVRIWGPRSVDKPLAKVLRGQMDPEYFPVALGDMAGDVRVTELRGDPVDIGPFHVEYGYLNHPGVTLGYRINVAGSVITYATDTEPYRYLLRQSGGEKGEEYGRKRDATLQSLVAGSDLYIADSQYTPDEYKAKMGWGHTCYLDALDVALDAGARRIALFSHDPMHDDDMIDLKLAHCQELVASRGASLEVLAAAESQCVIIQGEELDEVAEMHAAVH